MFGFSLGPKNTTVTEVHERLGTDGHVLLDVRTKEEVREISVPGALNIPLDRLEAQASQLAGYTSIDVMCRSGGRSAMAANMLHGLGLTHAMNVSGGIIAWQNAGLPTK
ncbi:MAG: rhodanese-like domain-containing protein [Minisyncoccota bacterium]